MQHARISFDANQIFKYKITPFNNGGNMSPAIRVNPNVSSFQFVEGARPDGILKRSCEAAIELIKKLATKISGALKNLWAALERFFGCDPVSRSIAMRHRLYYNSYPRWIGHPPVEPLVRPPIAAIPLNAPMQAKLLPYKDMQKSNVAFLQKSIELLRKTLTEKDKGLAAELERMYGKGWAKKYDIPKDMQPIQLKTFDEELENYYGEVFQKVLMGAIRAYIFSESDFVPAFFSHIIMVHEDPLQAAVEAPKPLKSKRARCEDHLKWLRMAFQGLPNDKKEIVFHQFDPPDIDKLGLPLLGKVVISEISAISNAILQKNKAFNDAIQQVK